MAIQENLLIDAAVRAGLVERSRLPELKSRARREQSTLMEILCRSTRYPASALYRAVAESRQLPFFEAGDYQLDERLLRAFNAQLLLRRQFLPVRAENEIWVLVTDPDDRSAPDSAQRMLGQPVRIAMAEPMLIESTLRRFFGDFDRGLNAVTVFDDIMKEAWVRKATDLHFEPMEPGMQLRMRVDGRMQEYHRPIDRQLAEALMTRIKVLAGLDIAEQQMAQDGGFAYRILSWADVDEQEMRVATVPTRWGERATLRILGQDTTGLTLAELGMPPEILQRTREAIRRPHGILLVTGPTGSGKSTTLYSALRELDAGERNILTVEDPIEQVVEGAGQVQVSEKVSFADALRSFLRHDPDVMLVGEIRDRETAETAVRAAMTGHLVLSTLHTNSAVAAVSRLVDIGCPRYLIASTLVGVLAQRLLRRLCHHCRSERTATERELRLLDIEPGGSAGTTVYEAQGCSRCLGSGYRGRIGVYETFWLNTELEQMIHEGLDDDQVLRAAKQAGLLSTLWQDARSRVLEGTTTLQEAMHLYG